MTATSPYSLSLTGRDWALCIFLGIAISFVGVVVLGILVFSTPDSVENQHGMFVYVSPILFAIGVPFSFVAALFGLIIWKAIVRK